ncbi:MAG: hypothetical protein EBR01_11350 [Proteobacteria bacterium]|nr:hypothetical protein [Pseudomonadota bacterium]
MKLGLSVLFWAITMAVGCSLSNPSKVFISSQSRGAISSRSEFEIFQLKSPSLLATDQVAVSFQDETRSCQVGDAVLGSSSELNFICLGDESNLKTNEGRGGPLSHKNFLWVSPQKELTHLWVNRLLYSCKTNKVEHSIVCEASTAVRQSTTVIQ